MNLDKIVQLFENPHTEDLSDRHASELSLMLESTTQFTYSQLKMLSHIIGLCYKSLVKGKVFNSLRKYYSHLSPISWKNARSHSKLKNLVMPSPNLMISGTYSTHLRPCSNAMRYAIKSRAGSY